jgi:leucine dehydrogenase
VAVQGLGHVGRQLAGLLGEAGARLVVSDLDRALVDEAVEALGARGSPPEAIAAEEVEVFAPCALGDALDERAIARLRCAVVAGSANTPLTDDRLADAIAARGILYAPDIAISGGGAIAAAFGAGGDEAQLGARLRRVPFMLDMIFDRAEREQVNPLVAAERVARERLAAQRAGGGGR